MCEKQAEKNVMLLWDSSSWILGSSVPMSKSISLGQSCHGPVEPMAREGSGNPSSPQCKTNTCLPHEPLNTASSLLPAERSF